MGQRLKVFIVFFLAFALEVRVKAISEKVQEQCFFKPHCFEQLSQNSAFKNKQETFLFLKSSLYKNESEKRNTHLVQGQLLIHDLQSEYTFKSLHGLVEIEFGDALLMVDSNYRLTVVNLNGKVGVSLRDGSQFQVPVGFSIWVDGVTTEGKNLTSALQPAQVEVVTNHFKVSDKRLTEWKEAQGNLTARAAEIYEASVRRELASIKDQQKEQANREEKASQRRLQQRQEILEKAFSR